jgi:hypothetical protein
MGGLLARKPWFRCQEAELRSTALGLDRTLLHAPSEVHLLSSVLPAMGASAGMICLQPKGRREVVQALYEVTSGQCRIAVVEVDERRVAFALKAAH